MKIVYRHFPLSAHEYGIPAAAASMAAHKQGKFWDYHDLLYKSDKKINDALLITFAERLSLDLDQFNRDRQSQEVRSQIETDIKDGKELGVSGTPVFFINGKRVDGAVPFSRFNEIIDSL